MDATTKGVTVAAKILQFERGSAFRRTLILDEAMDLSQNGLRSEYDGRFKWPELYTVVLVYALTFWIVVTL